MSSELVIVIVLINLVVIYLCKFLLEKNYKKQNARYKNKLSALLALNISHLHDAANFFSLLKNQTNDSLSQNFATGASYHFRSLFEELRQGKKAFDDDSSASVDLLYSKETVDLKDLLELELLQLSHSSRIELSDCSAAEHALVYGNFSLLSKIILNLSENAIKYTEKQVKIELSDLGNKWQIRISSFGKTIPESMVHEINEAGASSIGHGLTSLKEIMLFHDAELIIDTLAGEGSSIRLIFNKHNTSVNKTTPMAKRKAFRLGNQLVILISLLIVMFALIFTIHQNKKICLAYSQTKLNINDSEEIIDRAKYSKEALAKLYDALMYQDTSVYQERYEDFLDDFAEEDRELISLLLFEKVLTKAAISHQALITRDAKLLVVEYPDAMSLNSYLSNYYFQKSYYGRMLIHSLGSIIALFEAKLYIHPELFLVAAAGDDIESLSQFFAKFGSYKVIKAQELINSEPVPVVKPETGLRDLDKLIDEQDRDLGLDLESF